MELGGWGVGGRSWEVGSGGGEWEVPVMLKALVLVVPWPLATTSIFRLGIMHHVRALPIPPPTSAFRHLLMALYTRHIYCLLL